jgi:hypothetical protein
MQDQPATSSEGAPRLLFIVGMWRSGTSLIHALLNRHPEIALMYETEPLELWPNGAGLFGGRNWPQRLEFFNQTFTRHNLDERMFASYSPTRDGFLALYREYARARRAVIMGEKAPSYYKRLPELGELFPEAQFLIIWRDPIECCRSAVRAARQNRFFAQRGMRQRILLGAETLAQGVEWLLRENKSVCEVVYNELVENPERELRGVCEFLKIPFTPAILDLKSADVSSVPSGEHHAGVRSGTIEKAAATGEILPPAFVVRGRSYANFWHQRFSRLGFARALTVQPGSTHPGAAERFVDCCVRKCWRSIDASKQFLFRNIPLSCWSRLRSATPRANSRGNL